MNIILYNNKVFENCVYFSVIPIHYFCPNFLFIICTIFPHFSSRLISCGKCIHSEEEKDDGEEENEGKSSVATENSSTYYIFS